MTPANRKESPIPIVVKLGGSLYRHVPQLIHTIQESARPLLIVPGGGIFADEVRDASLPEDDAHWMAIRAMNRYGEYIASHGLMTSERLEIPESTVIFLPFRCIYHYDPLPHSWDVTSDTIAAWVAERLGLDLLILKSVDGIVINGVPATDISEPVLTDVVDPCCIPYILQHNIRADIINGSRPDLVARFLKGKRVAGTRIRTTFF